MAALDATYRLALVGTPNCGKSALFNALTGSRQKVANYPGATVERRAGRFTTEQNTIVDVVDLPGSYSLRGRSPDEAITRDVVLGHYANEEQPDVILCVLDATHLRSHLRFALEVRRLGLPMVVVLNMMDLVEHQGIKIDLSALEKELGVPVVPTIAVRKAGLSALISQLSKDPSDLARVPDTADPAATGTDASTLRNLQREAKRIAGLVIVNEGIAHRATYEIDRLALHPVLGPFILIGVMFVMFQAVFALAEAPMLWIDQGIVWLQGAVEGLLNQGFMRSLIVDGILAGVGSVLVFLPQIVILFAFILLFEASGYMTRAAFLLDRLMAYVGLNGRAFIPLLSSFACAVPGIMATRSIESPRDRLTTILIAPLMTCSARWPVYTLIIAAFIPNETVVPGVGLQGLVLFCLSLAGIVSAIIVAGVLRLTVARGASQPMIMEMPTYKAPQLQNLLLGLWERVKIFLKRAGTIILISMIILWVLASFPQAPVDAVAPAINYSIAGIIGQTIQPLFSPIGFNWEIVVALIPGMAAREVAIAALGTVYALSGSEDAVSQGLVEVLRTAWTVPTALAFLVWYVFAPQCVATLAAARRETNSWRWPIFMFVYLVVLAYLGAFITYRVALLFYG